MDDKEAKQLMEELPNKNFCPAPFFHAYMNANNRAHKLCCMSKIVGRWHDMDQDLQAQLSEFWTGDTMQSIRKEFMDGKMPKVCDWYCGRYEREKVWEESNRMHFISKYADHEETSHRNYDNLGLDIVHGNKWKKPIDIDLRPSKLCNLKCRSCNSTWSTEIEKEVLNNKILQGWTYWDSVTKSETVRKWAEQIDYDDPKFDPVSNIDLDNVKWLKMSGGETLIDPRVHKVLKKVVDSGHAKNLYLHLITNATSWNSRIADTISQFKHVTVNFSFDGTGKLEEYLRHGTKWDRHEEIFHEVFKLPNLHWAGIGSVVQPQSIFQIKDTMKWFLDGYRQYHPKHRGISFLPIVDPMFLSICWLDDDHKKEINKLLDECVEDYDMNKKEQQWFRTIRSEVNREISGHTTQAISPGRKKRLMLQFVRHQMALDKVRGTDTLSIEPKLERYFDRCKNDFQSDVLQFDVDGVVNGPA
tara:strand:+ start:1089 stop:2501 length:1413 start_codon:yes stop_codon:yes gene_type:complete